MMLSGAEKCQDPPYRTKIHVTLLALGPRSLVSSDEAASHTQCEAG